MVLALHVALLAILNKTGLMKEQRIEKLKHMEYRYNI